MEFYYHEVDHEVLILRADGGLDQQTSQQFLDELESLVQSGLRKIIVDCSGLTYVSSAGLGLLMRVHRMMKKHDGNVKLAGIRGVVSQLLATVHLDKMFEFYPDVDRARLAFRPKVDVTVKDVKNAKSGEKQKS